MVYNRRIKTMKKTIFMGIAALMLCGTVNATSWRVCSKPEAGANFLSVAEAVASNSVFAGDTLYLEPGHTEIGYPFDIHKTLILIGPGNSFVNNGINVMNNEPATFFCETRLTSAGTKIIGCKFISRLLISSDNITIDNCHFTAWLDFTFGYSGIVIRGCFFNNCGIGAPWVSSNSFLGSSVIENNIINGDISATNENAHMVFDFYRNSVIRNNTITTSLDLDLIRNATDCEIYNNIIINTNQNYITSTNNNQTVDTTWYRNFVMDAPAERGNNVYNNILSCTPNPEYLNCVFNATVEDVLIWNGANTLEEKYKHKADGPAVGAGVSGTTCGAYGAVNGSRPYQPAGIPQYRPYIYDAQIDETPSSNNTINASFKIKVQQ